jgi:hypothetical protein
MGRGHAWMRPIHGLCGVDHGSGGVPKPEEEADNFLLLLALQFLFLFLPLDLLQVVVSEEEGW